MGRPLERRLGETAETGIQAISDMKPPADKQGELNENTLENLRTAIDDIDRQIVEFINRRLLLAKRIGRIKQERGGQVLDPVRESEIFSRLSELNDGPIHQRHLHHIFSEIMAICRDIQRPLSVAYLGPEATFTHMAAIQYFGHSTTFLPQAGIRDVFDEVEKNVCHYGVVPVENSIEGAVNHTLDLFFESDLKICAEVYYPVVHDLLAVSENPKDIRVVYSHPHALAQCRGWLRKQLPEAILMECASTAEASRKAAETPGTAAIASGKAAPLYGLKVVFSKIEDMSRNVTRFLVIGPVGTRQSKRDKTSLMFSTAHVPGALHRALRPLDMAGINMVKLESRPTRHENWNYFFFADIEGHMADPRVHETVERMKADCLFIKCLGSYPMAEDIPGIGSPGQHSER